MCFLHCQKPATFFLFGLNGTNLVFFSLSIFSFFIYFLANQPIFLNAELQRAIREEYKMAEEAVINGLEEVRLGTERNIIFQPLMYLFKC